MAIRSSSLGWNYYIVHVSYMHILYNTLYKSEFKISPLGPAVVIDAYPNTATVEQGTTLILVCRVVGVSSTTVLSYQWTCPGGYCDAGAVDPEWAARIHQGNILVVNVHRANSDNGKYTCTVIGGTQQVGSASKKLAVTCEFSNYTVNFASCNSITCYANY